MALGQTCRMGDGWVVLLALGTVALVLATMLLFAWIVFNEGK